MTDEKLTLKHTVAEVNLILQGLGQLPYREVFSLINEVQNQATQQVAPSLEPVIEDEKKINKVA